MGGGWVVMRVLRQWIAKRRLAADLARRRADNAQWASNRQRQLSPERRARIATIIQTGVRP